MQRRGRFEKPWCLHQYQRRRQHWLELQRTGSVEENVLEGEIVLWVILAFFDASKLIGLPKLDPLEKCRVVTGRGPFWSQGMSEVVQQIYLSFLRYARAAGNLKRAKQTRCYVPITTQTGTLIRDAETPVHF